MDLLIIGVGYVGLVTGACLAEMGHRVLCLDINEEKIKRLNEGSIPFYEPGLEEMVKRNVSCARLHFTSSYDEAIQKSSICFLAVDTPNGHDGKTALTSLRRAYESIAERMSHYMLFVNKSTVPVGTAEKMESSVQDVLKKRGINIDFDIVSNPEFLKEGDAINDFMKPDRVIIGTSSPKAAELLKKIYSPFMLSRERLLVMDVRSAELTKYAANAMLATRISFMNELAGLAEKLGASIHAIRAGIGSDHRIGYNYLYAGLGFGGSCLPKDIQSLREQAKEVDHEMQLLATVQQINERQKRILSSKIKRYFEKRGGVQGKTIALLGLSFKPETDDMREAPSLILIQEFLQMGAHVRTYDPVATENARKILGDNQDITWCQSELEAAKNAHAIALVTEWKQFRHLDFAELKKVMVSHAFFDGRNQYSFEEMKEWGFDYFPIGMPQEL